MRTNKTPRGPTPTWYKQIQTQFSNNSTKLIWPNIQLEHTNSFINTLNFITTLSTIIQKNNWTLYKTEHQIHIGKIKLFNSNNLQLNIYSSIYTTGLIHLSPTSQILNIKSKNTINFTCKSQKEKQYFKLSIDFKELQALSMLNLYPHRHQHFSSIQIQIQNPIIEQIKNTIITPSYQQELINLHNQISQISHNNLHFYSDALIQNSLSSNIKSRFE